MQELSQSEWTVLKCLVYQEMQKFNIEGPVYPMLESIYHKILYKEGIKNG